MLFGAETARRLVEAGHTVVGARDPERGRAAAASLGARFVRIDVTDDASVEAAAADVAAHEGAIDVLVNNAGVLGRVGPVEEYTAADMSAVLDVNVVGVVRVTHAFLPLLRKSSHPVIVNVSTGMGSFGMTQDPARIESQYARELKDMKVNAADPGQTATDFTGGIGHSVAEGADSIVALATIGPDGPTGQFVDRSGTLPW
ncbi:SDR family NAD(P)-dependent oxidoreductase [Streptomyces sp. NEAU-sy36]|uniref:SDR family NAD(P)-dependent oxidoreductase n=1 Tax=unclassified Streptomyces TaxID=2593676 RepID=UPI0015D5A79A|nr:MULTISPECIES: SDR family NAD(P)-dependent oxidoreductase [unclassified Streptomyces]QLJ02954.1 SDR family NAD(P)-dependent oxidoreductase [Streptomyces sp. NEAU-sy36]